MNISNQDSQLEKGSNQYLTLLDKAEQQLGGTRFYGGPETVHGSYLPFRLDGEEEYGKTWARGSLGGKRAFISHQGNIIQCFQLKNKLS